MVIYVPSVYINLSAAGLAGLFQPGCLLRGLGDFSCLWDPEQEPAPAKFLRRTNNNKQRRGAGGRSTGPHGIPAPQASGRGRGDRGCRPPLPPPWLPSSALFCGSSDGYLLFVAPLGSPPIPPPLPAWKEAVLSRRRRCFPLGCEFW